MQGKNHRISDIKEELKSIQDGKLDGFIKKYDEDTRSGVVKLVDTAKNVWKNTRMNCFGQKISKNMKNNIKIMVIYVE